MKLDYERENDAVLEYFSKQSDMREAFAELENSTSPGSVVLCWWDYGRAVREWSHRDVIEAYPSRDIWYSVGSTRTFLGNLKAQLFGTWGSSEKIHDLANIFMLPEEQSLTIMRKYDVTYALVFTPDDLQKFYWIADIAGYKNSTEFLTHNSESDSYEPTTRGSQVTLLRLLFDNTLHPQHFTKLHDGRAKIYRIDYS